MSLVLLAAAGACVASLPGQSTEPAALTAVRFWSFGEVTRVAIETDSEVTYRWERLPNPDRVFFDLLATKKRIGPRGIHTIPVGDKLLKQIRVAQTELDVARVVLDLAAPVELVASQLANPDRIVIELRAAPAAPATAAPLLPPPPAIEIREAAAVGAATEPEKRPSPPAEPARGNSQGERSLIRALGLKIQRVVLDSGHGGHDTGTIGRGGLMEKDLALDLAKRLGALIEQRLGAEVIYTRTDDTFVPLEARITLANERKADLFLSIHANSSRLRSASGSETYYLNLTTSRLALEVAARENAGSQMTISELQDLVQKITLREKADESREFAGSVQNALHGATRSRNRGVKKAPFVVLIGAAMPSVLAEVGFLSNPREEILLKRPDHRQRLAEALFKGVAQYAATLSHFKVARDGGRGPAADSGSTALAVR